MDAELAAKLVPLAPDHLLRTLAALGAGTALDERPVVRLWLAAGHAVEGRLVGLGTDRDEEIVVLGCPADRRQLPDEAVYLRVRDIVAAGVRQAERYRDVLSGGTLPAPTTGEPVSRLALRRRFAASPDLPLRLDWDAVPASGEVTANLAALLEALRQAVSAVRGDDLGRRAWAEVSEVRVEHRPGQQLTVRRTPDGLLVAADLAAAMPRSLANEVNRQLDAAL